MSTDRPSSLQKTTPSDLLRWQRSASTGCARTGGVLVSAGEDGCGESEGDVANTGFDRPDLYGSDIYTEPDPDPKTLSNLGPLRHLAGTWRGQQGRDVHPNVDVTGSDSFDETYVLEPIDPQTNGPQLLYGLRYHTHLVKPGEVKTFHDQVGYWLWEPMAEVVMLILGIPRGQVLLAGGHATANSRQFEVSAAFGSETFGISSSPFLDRAFRTLSYRQLVSLHDNGSWSYEEEAVMEVEGRMLPVHHTDGNTLALVAPPHSNPLASPPN